MRAGIPATQSLRRHATSGSVQSSTDVVVIACACRRAVSHGPTEGPVGVLTCAQPPPFHKQSVVRPFREDAEPFLIKVG